MATQAMSASSVQMLKNDPSYPGFAYANDSRYGFKEFRMAQAQRYYIDPVDSPDYPSADECYWILWYCKEEIQELKKRVSLLESK